MSFGPYQILS